MENSLQHFGPSDSVCLIGYTGFVGSTLIRQGHFSHYYNSSNIDQIVDRQFDTVVCAAAAGSMFEANKFPHLDWAKIDLLVSRLARIKARRMILISSIATLANFSSGEDEGTNAFEDEIAYGRHRRYLEAFCENRFPHCLIVRLPALFGTGLKKNFIFDLMNPVPTMLTSAAYDSLSAKLLPPLRERLARLYSHDAMTGLLKLDRPALNDDCMRSALERAVIEHGASSTQFHNPETNYQYYDMSRLWHDLAVACNAGLSHIHLVSQPLKASRIHERLLGRPMPDAGAQLHIEDMRTRHAELWGRSGQYLEDAEPILDRLAAFFDQELCRV
jgi:hypothetical protein